MIKVLHWINLSRMYRCHLTFENDKEITNYYITDIKRHNLKTKPNVFAGFFRDVQFLEKVLNKVKPDVIITCNLVKPHLMELMKKKCKYFVYISHSIMTESSIQKKLENRENEQPHISYSIFDKMYVLEKEYEMWKKLGIEENKLKKVYGLTYMDLLFTTNKQLNKEKLMKLVKYKPYEEAMKMKTILFLHNHTITGCIDSKENVKDLLTNSFEYEWILRELIKFAEKYDCHIFCKIGRTMKALQITKEIQELHEHERVSIIYPNDDYLLADFLFCDAILNQSYSAAYQESLLGNPCVSCVYLNKSTEIIDSNKYPLLPVIRSLSDIEKIVYSFMYETEKYRNNKEYENQINQLIIDTFGSKLQNVTNTIVEDIKSLNI